MLHRLLYMTLKLTIPRVVSGIVTGIDFCHLCLVLKRAINLVDGIKAAHFLDLLCFGVDVPAFQDTHFVMSMLVCVLSSDFSICSFVRDQNYFLIVKCSTKPSVNHVHIDEGGLVYHDRYVCDNVSPSGFGLKRFVFNLLLVVE